VYGGKCEFSWSRCHATQVMVAEESSDVTIKVEFKKRENHRVEDKEAPEAVRVEDTVFGGPTEKKREWNDDDSAKKLLPPPQVLEEKKDEEWS
jgi:hypothetical protein